MLTNPFILKSFSLKQKFLQLFRVSYIIHFYRIYIKSNAISLAYRYTFSKDLLRRYRDFIGTKKSYRILRNVITLKIRFKKIHKSWQQENYSLFIKLILLFIFAWPIWAIKKLMIAYLWLKPFFTILAEHLKTIMTFINSKRK